MNSGVVTAISTTTHDFEGNVGLRAITLILCWTTTILFGMVVLVNGFTLMKVHFFL